VHYCPKYTATDEELLEKGDSSKTCHLVRNSPCNREVTTGQTWFKLRQGNSKLPTLFPAFQWSHWSCVQ